MTSIAQCPDPLPPELEKPLHELAAVWAGSIHRPVLLQPIVEWWDKLLDEWVADEELPLFVRKKQKNYSRGEIVIHQSGRKLIPTDNSPAQWSFAMALHCEKPKLADVHALLQQDKIPVAMAMGPAERERASFHCFRGAVPNPNAYGWKVCHKEGVRLSVRGPIREVAIDALKSHFKRFLAPSNMFLVPKVLSGLGGLPQFIAALRGKI